MPTKCCSGFSALWRGVRGSPLERSWYSLAMEFQHLTWLHQRHPMSNGRGNGKALKQTGHQGPSKRWRVTVNAQKKKPQDKKHVFLGTCDVETGDRRKVAPFGHVLSENINTLELSSAKECVGGCTRGDGSPPLSSTDGCISAATELPWRFTAVCGLSDETTLDIVKEGLCTVLQSKYLIQKK